jgi:2-methylisocitrate lyase-like PEP mutase family enzyme
VSNNDKAKVFATLHQKGNPIVIFNAWDAGSATAIALGGARAIGTSSWAVAAAQGYKDGENLPLESLLKVAARIARTVDIPVSVDFEGGYSDDDLQLSENVSRLIETGAIGINFEDRVVKGEGLHEVDRQARRIEAIRNVARAAGIDLFINARTDVFFHQGTSEATIESALARAHAYAAAGASGLFVPGLVDETLIAQICERTTLPVNVMMSAKAPTPARLAELGVSRISYATFPYISAMEKLQQDASRAFQRT